ncbi:hypothetical protein A3D85_00525 [Candidatus Amesbacteria bacterium RIFCSPHIGHO2_02_FULL_47_9]|uniref:Uncharacterized protein n=1 Tax=Candidatus Amesbacteria bacterium RIFCSPHIGHO2_01_FULL_48_32b TaxID=1797253 RepID=A0A1F4YE84_9BACT|nr:MAG: hypothetical protein A2876_01715 [Candidatus Amesbacteria bacterium RIFCSPHIGHO2_01_FULL_48_32b]OGD04909.1 MAG: hypothetical protein A3D85_00525 [Candidatus Amesbacteria bacterium RIFCSPHIGHO2_02_FULL_47_9]OGD07282.1 MAG: hypothetical protein A2899_04735 [Candidatus Amesbacteria bacterium RIFCSPLOWO2_01_FULL_49_25]
MATLNTSEILTPQLMADIMAGHLDIKFVRVGEKVAVGPSHAQHKFIASGADLHPITPSR